MIRVAVVSPNSALRVGLRELLGRQPDIQVIGEAVDLESVHEMEAEVFVLASVSSGRLLENSITSPILFLTDDVESVRMVLGSKVRAWGVLSLEATEDELAAAVRAVGEGLWVGAPGLVGEMIRFSGRRESLGEESLTEQLTAREKEVIQLMAQGLANKQIALSLGISEHTVKFHLSSLYSKLGISSRTEAIKRGIELGLISL
ncbi:MAG TPA: response regulator transcription factor [Anaerolineales bacterium]|nr:response regulator transcription factor [Anaerolineales bacterium]HMX20026.1 response regulator transcription factor [Anaerolineales bacterium]HMX75693.1 response regulator transcription factor [Anaerolineales bacterium]HMZ43759.1 response regulator transcription factor [Anaerolineales bacterium]HNF35478.1 response regulator transcription factor [Anaerolineales bacterium]